MAAWRVAGDADVVVVGGGHNGLICAAYLARAGVNTVLVEARSTVGGCASTVPALGARVNICNCDHVAIRSVPLVEELDLAAHGLRYLDLEAAQVATSWVSKTTAVLFHDVERTLDSIRLTHPDQLDGYRRYLKSAAPAAQLMLELGRQMPTPGVAIRTLSRHRGRGLATLLAWSKRSAASVLRSFFTDEVLLGTALSTGPAVWGVSPYASGTGLGALRYAMLHAVAPGRPIGGSGAFTDAVLGSFLQAGGIARSGVRVDRFLLQNDQLRGVRLEGGEELRCRRVVVACDPRAALLEWLGDPPPSAATALAARWRQRPSYDGYESKVDVTLDALPRFLRTESLVAQLGVSAADLAGATTLVAPSVDGIAHAHGDAASGRVASKPIMMVNVPSALDPTVAPEGGHLLSLEVLFTPYALRGGWPTSTEPRRWLDLLSTRLAPGFQDSIRDFRVVTPDVYEQDFGMPRGYAQSFSGGPLSALLGKDPELTRYRTPVSGLYLTGAAAFPGAGVWGAAGRNAAHVVLRDLNRARARV